MRLVNGFKLMEFAKRYHYVLPAFNTTNLEMTYAIAAVSYTHLTLPRNREV